MYKVQGYMGVQRRYKGVEGRCRRVRGHIGEQRRFKGVEGICREKGTGIYGSTKTIQGSRGDMWRGTGLTYMGVNGRLYEKRNGNTREYWARFLEGWLSLTQE